MSAYVLLAKKAFRRNLQYRAAHMANNVGSMIFGLIYIAIWQAAARGGEAGPYNAQTLAWWVAFNQVMLWVAVFLPHGLGIPEMVRTGAVSLEMLRPLDFHLLVISRELGTVWYNLWFRTLPLAIVFAFAIGVYVPKNPVTYPLLLLRDRSSRSTSACASSIWWGSPPFGRWNPAGRGSSPTRCRSSSPALWCRSIFYPHPSTALPGVLPFAPLHHDPASIYLEHGRRGSAGVARRLGRRC